MTTAASLALMALCLLLSAYFSATDAAHRCDLLLRVTPDAHGDNEYEVIDP